MRWFLGFVVLIGKVLNYVAHALHEPSGSGSCPTDADAFFPLEPCRVDVILAADEMGIGVSIKTLGKQNTSVAALGSTNKEDELVSGGEIAYLRNAVGHRAADGIKTAKGHSWFHAVFDFLNYMLEFLHTLGRLGVQVDVAGIVNIVNLVDIFDDGGMTLGLAYEAQHLGMTTLTVDDDLRGWLVVINAVVGGMDALLQFQHNRAGGIDNLDMVASGGLIGLGRFAMGAQQHLHVMQAFQLLVGDSLKAAACQTIYLGSVVHDVAQAIQVPTLVKFLLGLADGCCHSEAESRPVVNLDDRHVLSRLLISMVISACDN